MRTGTGNGARKRESSSVSALGPPVEVPIVKSFGGPKPSLTWCWTNWPAAGLAVGPSVGGRVSNLHLPGERSWGVVGRTGLADLFLNGLSLLGWTSF